MIIKDVMAGACNTCKENNKFIKNIWYKIQGKRQFWRSSCRWEDNIKMDIGQIICKGMQYIKLILDSSNTGFCEYGDKTCRSVQTKYLLAINILSIAQWDPV
jgi:hypothetical protein